MKRCMYCGQENDDANTTCEKCGNPLLETPPIEEIQVEELPDDREEEAAEDTLTDEPLAADDDGESSAEILVEEEEADIPEEDIPEFENGADDTYEDQDEEALQEPEYVRDLPFDDLDTPKQQYGGQAYGYYDSEPGQYGREPEEDYERGYARGRLSPLMKASRRKVKGFLFFLSTLLLTVHVVSNIVNIMLGNALTNLSTVTNTIRLRTGDNTILRLCNTGIAYLESVNPWMLRGISVALMLPILLLMFGFWRMFAGTSSRRVAMSTGGYSLTRAAVIIRFIFVCAVLLAAIVVTVAFVVTAGASGSTMSLIVGIVCLLIVIILAVLIIMFYVQVIFSVKLIRRNVLGEDIGSIPGYAVFVGVLLAIGNGLAMLPMAPDDYIGLVARGSAAAWLLFTSIWAMSYKSKMRKVRR